MTAKRVVPAHLTWQDETGVAHQMYFDLVKGEDYTFGADVTEHPVEVGSNVTDNVRVRTEEATLEVLLTNEPIASNNEAQFVQGANPLSLPSAPPQPPAPAVIQYDKWSNMINERALATGVGGLVGGALGGTVGSLVGAGAGGVLGALLLQPHATPVVQSVTMGKAPSPPAAPMVAQTFSFTEEADFVADTIAELRDLKNKAQLFSIVAPRLTVDEVVIADMKVHRDDSTGTGAQVTLTMKQIRFVATVTVPAPAIAVQTAKPAVSRGEQNPQPATPAQQNSVAESILNFIRGGGA